MFALSAALDRRGDGDSRPELVVRWLQGPRACQLDMADVRAAGAGLLVLDLGDRPLDGEAVAAAAGARQAGLAVEVVAGTEAGWSPETAARLRDAGVAEAAVRVALESWPPRPRRRGWHPPKRVARAVEAALEAGLRTGVAFRLTRTGTGYLSPMLDWIERSGASGCDVAHVMPAGDLDWRAELALPGQVRFALRELVQAAWRWRRLHLPRRIRTWHGPADPLFVYIWCLRHAPEQAPGALAAARAKAGAWPDVAWIDPLGNVSAVAAMPALTLGTVGTRRFSEIWLDRELPGWERTRALYAHVGAPCTACPWHGLCHGGERARAMTGDSLAGPDPGCCLTVRETAPVS